MELRGWLVTIRSTPRERLIAFVLGEQPVPIFDPGGAEGEDLLVVGAVDPEAVVFRLHAATHRSRPDLH
jgi:hypothetical protein